MYQGSLALGNTNYLPVVVEEKDRHGLTYYCTNLER